ncbi:hypothetical protein XI06_10170 [Bradyrhizobium sp. CCBAU 11434]|nr:hypothetical protein [Bradyrhizobium sp. CCBAU 11434]
MIEGLVWLQAVVRVPDYAMGLATATCVRGDKRDLTRSVAAQPQRSPDAGMTTGPVMERFCPGRSCERAIHVRVEKIFCTPDVAYAI